MNFSEYSTQAASTAVYPGENSPIGLLYAALGLANEAGEAAGKVKKALRDDNLLEASGVTPGRRQEIIDECGDVLWYLEAVLSEIGSTLEEAARANIAKLTDRDARGVLQGSGDKR